MAPVFDSGWRRMEPDGRMDGWMEPVSGIEPLTCRLQDGCSAY
jgi:hypothetical protein